MPKKTILTLEQLVAFCQENKFYNFSAADTGYSLSVQVAGNLDFAKKSDYEAEDLLFVKVKTCHTLKNRNNSYISEDNMKKAMASLKYKPVLASIVETDNGLDFNGHDMEFIETEEGITVKYIERQVGAFTADAPYLEYDEENDKTYVMAIAAIPREYTEAADIIERKDGTKVSVELTINTMSYNVVEGYLELEDFVFAGMTLLGESVAEGMQGARADILDFSAQNNSVLFEKNEELLNRIQKLEEAFNEHTSLEKGGNEMKFEELLQKYGKTVEDITFEYKGKTDEELEALFEEAFAKEEEGEKDPEPEPEADPEPEPKPEKEEEFSATYSVTIGKESKCYSVSITEKLNALSTLVNDTYSDDCTYYSVDVFEEEKYVLMVDCWSGKAYKQSYKVKKDNYMLVGDRVEVFAVYVTADEKAELERMKNTYSSISDKLAKYEAEPEKIEILSDNCYAAIAGNEEFQKLNERATYFDLTVEEVKSKADAILLEAAKSGQFNFEKKEGINRKPYASVKKQDNRYGSLFSH